MWVMPYRQPGKLTPPDALTMSSRCVELGPGERVGEHVTEGCEEMLFVLEGEATVLLRGTPTRVRAGHVTHIPPETRHDVANEGDAPLRYVYVTARIGRKS